MMTKLADFLNLVQIGDPMTHANMSVYPLRLHNGHQRGYRTLDDALQAGELTVSEVSEGGSVPALVVSNEGELPVLMVVGEELVGARQNRVLNTSILVPAKSTLQIPVSCVERGRWSYTSRRFSTHETTSHFELRKTQTANVTASLRSAHDTTVSFAYNANQGAVWQEVDRKMQAHRTPSPTASMHDIYEQTGSLVKDYLEALPPPEDAQGFLVAINGEVVGGDLFDHTETLKALWNKLIRGYAIDALERQRMAEEGGASQPDTRQFLMAALRAQEEHYQSVGLGEDVRLSSEDVTGSSLLWDDHLIHASLFRAG
jgi:hypothetical protein